MIEHVAALKDDSIEAIQQWFVTPLGAQLLEEERDVLAKIMPSIFGYHLLQISVLSREALMECTGASHCFSLVPRIELGTPAQALVADAENLPFSNECIDAVVLHHTLDFADSSHQVLREASRVLRPGGKVVIVGFNPASLWGVCRQFVRRSKALPWCGRFLSHRRIQDWLALLELKEEQNASGYYRPPVSSKSWMQRFAFVERWGRRYRASNGAFYVIVATKETLCMTRLGAVQQRRMVLPFRPVISRRCARQVNDAKP